MLGYCYIADAEWGAWSPTQTTPALAISQSRRISEANCPSTGNRLSAISAAVSSLRDAERSVVEWEPPKSTKAPLGRSQLFSRRFHLP